MNSSQQVLFSNDKVWTILGVTSIGGISYYVVDELAMASMPRPPGLWTAVLFEAQLHATYTLTENPLQR